MNNKQNCRAARVFGLFLGLGASATLLAPSLVMAQAEPTADETIWGSNKSTSIVDAIQRGQTGSSQTPAEFRSNQSKSLSEAAAAFRALQQQALEQDALETTTPAPAMTPETESAETEEGLLQSRAMEDSPRPALW